jgi:hypothetical protein
MQECARPSSENMIRMHVLKREKKCRHTSLQGEGKLFAYRGQESTRGLFSGEEVSLGGSDCS